MREDGGNRSVTLGQGCGGEERQQQQPPQPQPQQQQQRWLQNQVGQIQNETILPLYGMPRNYHHFILKVYVCHGIVLRMLGGSLL